MSYAAVAGKSLPGMSRESSKAPVQKSPIFVKPDSEKKAKKTKIKLPRQSTNNSDVDTAKKRKAEDGDHIKRPTKALKSDESERKKAKKAKKTTARPKGPVDVEKQCGVPLPAGGLCARSLTCKSHSMGSKRAVPGRSQPYDILLAQYQKKNHAKQSMKAAGDQGYHDYDDGVSPVDSDEEVSAVSEAVSKTISRPLERKVVMPIRRRHRFFRMREMMMTALKPGAQNGAQIIGKYIPFKVDPQP